MLETQFFPTPTATIWEMLWFLAKDSIRRFINSKQRILDPEAGSGNILDLLVTAFEVKKSQLYAIEIDPDLRYTLQGKNYKVIGTDFLEYEEPCTFDLILMNPPFSEGAAHVIKAWEVLSEGGHLAALLNAQTLRNPCTQERQYLLYLLSSMLGGGFNSETNVDELLKVLEKENYIKWLGSCFKNSERPTNVEVVLIKLEKPKKSHNNLFEGLNLDLDGLTNSEGFAPNTLAQKNVIADLVARYNAVRKVVVDRHELQFKIDFYLQGISAPVYESDEFEKRKSLKNEFSLNEQLLVLKSQFWNTVFEKTELGKRTPSDFQKKFTDFALSQSYISFTQNNVEEVLMIFAQNMNEVMKESLVKVFDQATAHHEDNRVSEGWKTNKSWKLNKRIIMPYTVTFQYDDFSIVYSRQPFLTDLDKVLCWLTSKKFEDINSTFSSIASFCHEANRTGAYQQKFESTFFIIKMFKKGTVHLDFKDLNLLADFNRIAAEGKNWIGSEQPLG